MGLQQKKIEIMKRIDRVPKNGRNDFHKYDYVTEADLVEAVRQHMTELGVAFSFSVESHERQGDITTAVCSFSLIDAESGEQETVTVPGSGQDKTDKGLYKAYTGAQKYFFMKTFLVPTGDDPERDEPPKKSKSAKLPDATKGSRTSAQMAKIMARVKQNKLSPEAMKAMMLDNFSVDGSKFLSYVQANELITELEA